MDKLMSMKEVAEQLNVSYKTVYNWVKSGKLKAMKAGGVVRISEKQLNDFIKVARE